jgi:glutamine amidotransferase
LLEDLLFEAKHSLIDQSMCSRSTDSPTNGDGFGIGWYAQRDEPGLFRSIRPAWNDANLRDLSAHIESPLFLAHVRATSLATVQETNCHPFRYRQWLFVHNGEIAEADTLRRDLLFAVDPKLFANVAGTTDSEVMFHLALTFGLEDDPPAALARMVGFVEQVAAEHGVADAIRMTVGISDGHRIHAARYATDGDAPTLYHSRHMEDLCRLNPALRDQFDATSRAIVSEPIGDLADAWIEIEQNTAVCLCQGAIEMRPFVPAH